MGSFHYVIKDEIGIHARPAGMLAKMAKGFDSAVTIRKVRRLWMPQSSWQLWDWE